MQAGREMDVKVAEALGYEVGKFPPDYYIVVDGDIESLPHFSTTWGSMGVLVEEAEKQGILLEYEHFRDGRYLGRAWKFCEKLEKWLYIKSPVSGAIPHAVSLSFLKVKGIEL
jgi:hypothetical protein